MQPALPRSHLGKFKWSLCTTLNYLIAEIKKMIVISYSFVPQLNPLTVAMRLMRDESSM